MRIQLIKPRANTDSVVPPLGLGYLATALRPAHEVFVLNALADRLSLAQVTREVARLKPDLVGIQVYTSDRDVVADYLAAFAALRPRPTLVLGGPHPSSAPAQVLTEFPAADFAIAGEAEVSFRQLADHLATPPPKRSHKRNIAGLIWREGTAIHRTPPVFGADMEAFGEPAWDLLKPEHYPHAPFAGFVRRFPVAPIIASRGCPRRCTFCAAGYLSGHRVRYRSPAAIVDEILRLKNEHGIREFQFADDNLTADPRVVTELCELLLERGVDLPWSCPNGVRVERLDRTLLSLMKQAGCHSLAVGIESGSERILRQVCKDSSLPRIRKALDLMREVGILSVGYFMFGFPQETDEDRRLTINLALELPLDRAQFMLYCPLPGTPLYEDVRRSGRFQPSGSYGFNSILHVPESTTATRLRWTHKEAFVRFYLRPHQLWLLLTSVRDPAHLLHLAGRIQRWLLGAAPTDRIGAR